MKTSKIKATATEKTVTTITIEIEGKKHNLTREDAKAIYDELAKVFGPKHDPMEDYKKREWLSGRDGIRSWPISLPNTSPRPFEITC